MTRLFNRPEDFADEMIEGFAAAASRWVQAAPGGVVRSTTSGTAEVALVIGGGSGHYPAFGGLVGPGLAHGAAMGNLFASPSAQQVHAIATVCDSGRGVLLSYGNYAGDVLHFDQAQQRLRAQGIDVRTVTVTDDIWSAPPQRRHERRGIAGDLCVFKTAGAAAAAGYDLDGVERVARLANDRTRSFGVAFSGCTLPGAEAPLFDVPAGRMAVGLGIHGEPGIDEVPVPSAAELAELFVDRLFDEVPPGVDPVGARVVPLLNGLGSVKSEELFVVYATVARLLSERGVEVVEPEVGELCTSFDMAGCSLTLFWLDDELERLWKAPAESSGFRKGSVAGQHRADQVARTDLDASSTIPAASAASRAVAAQITAGFDAIVEVIDANVEELGRMDRVAGDGDHGIGMQRGARAAAHAAHAAATAGAGARTVLDRAAEAWSDRAGGTSGALWATILHTLAAGVGDERAPDASDVARAVAAASEAVMSFGKAQVGDKTMVDAIVPFAVTLQDEVASGADLPDAWATAARAAREAAESTAHLRARRGRAKTHGEHSIGTPDPGAVSFAGIVQAVQAARPQPDRPAAGSPEGGA